MLVRLIMVIGILRSHPRAWLAITLTVPLVYYVALIAAPVIRFGQWPNYLNTYDWLGSVQLIASSTPSWRDVLMIAKDEWVLELGYMNYDFGIGLSQWSVFIAPVKVLGVVLLGALLATLYLLLKYRPGACSRGALRRSQLAGGTGAGFIALASVTLSWVVCCSTPTWVVGLAMMGLSVSTSLWLEPLGVWVNLVGFTLLLAAILMASAQNSGTPVNHQ